jgi:hypothetical protein
MSGRSVLLALLSVLEVLPLLPVAAAFVMTQWDLVMDPPSSTIAKAGSLLLSCAILRGSLPATTLRRNVMKGHLLLAVVALVGPIRLCRFGKRQAQSSIPKKLSRAVARLRGIETAL